MSGEGLRSRSLGSPADTRGRPASWRSSGNSVRRLAWARRASASLQSCAAADSQVTWSAAFVSTSRLTRSAPFSAPRLCVAEHHGRLRYTDYSTTSWSKPNEGLLHKHQCNQGCFRMSVPSLSMINGSGNRLVVLNSTNYLSTQNHCDYVSLFFIFLRTC